MHPINKILSIAGASALLFIQTACDTTKYDELAQRDLQGSGFSQQLASEYKAFAKSEIDQYDWPDQQHMAIKGLIAANGGRPLPEDPKNWNISKTDTRPLYQSRANLIHWLNTDARQSHPDRAAKAQRNFDCWVEQKEENWQKDHIKACREATARFTPAMSQVHFAFDSSKLNTQAKRHLRRVAQNWRRAPGQFLLVQGHADRIGKSAYNYKLARKRAHAVQRNLESLGIAKKHIKLAIWGETRPRPASHIANHIALSQQNRRVEILKY